ncbi:hypothetical protein K490DRAFT_63572 [Saccharata proteae CBS 121410]|uniref:Uncharacterized protein n=1 Tax=Saccharata proteae CBS 121410 TaxID=1314787 RepID=A0A6A5YD33_9PEZI|nr:hypothetical protein K490DRAFT_63572 [Saccharata proteae CBS 121410]
MAATTNLPTTPQEPISASALSTRTLLASTSTPTPTPSDFPIPPASPASSSPTATTTRMSAAELALADNESHELAYADPAAADPRSILQTSSQHQHQNQRQLPVRPPAQRQPSTNYITALAAAAQASLNSTPSTPGADLPIARAKPKVGATGKDENSVEKGEGLIQGMRPFLDRHQSWQRQDARREAQRALMADVAGEDAFGYETAGGRDGRKEKTA